MIRTEHLSKDYAGSLAVANLSIDVPPGEIYGLVGPNGAGKTTILRILCGLIAPTSGRAIVKGFDVAADPLNVKRHLGYVPEAPRLYGSLSPCTFIDFVGALHHIDPLAARSRASVLLDSFEIGSERHSPIQQLSKGTRQKVVIAAALIHQPDVLILDEPFDGLDPHMSAVVQEMLVTLALEGRTIVVSTHMLHVVEQMCERVCVLNRGRVLAEGTIGSIRRASSSDSLASAFAALTHTGAASRHSTRGV